MFSYSIDVQLFIDYIGDTFHDGAMNVIQGYEYDPENGRIYSKKNRRNREWCRKNRNGTKKWRDQLHAHREKVKKHSKIEVIKERRRREMLSRARWRAKQAGYETDLSLEDIKIPDVCPFEKKPFRFREGKAHPLSPSLDRMNPRRRYRRGNVWVISMKANRQKSNLTADKALAFFAAMVAGASPERLMLKRFQAKKRTSSQKQGA